MEATVPTSAPAPAAVPPVAAPAETMRAVEHATATGDFADFKKATRAERAGTPLPPVELKPDTKPERTVSKRQQAINDRIRTAVETATREKDAEIARLKTPAAAAAPAPTTVPAPIAAAAPAPVTPPPAKDWKYYAGLPGAPKLTDKDAQGQPIFSSVEEHAAAMSLFVQEARDRDQQEHTAAQQRERWLNDEKDRFGSNLRKAHELDKDLPSKIPQEVLDAAPLRYLPLDDIKGGKATFANFVAEIAYRSEDAARFLTYLGAHRDEGDRILKLAPGLWLDALTRLDGRLMGSPSAPSPSVPAPAPVAAPKVVSAVPAPLPTLGTRASAPTDPVMAAAVSGDMRAYRAAMNARRAASAKG